MKTNKSTILCLLVKKIYSWSEDSRIEIEKARGKTEGGGKKGENRWKEGRKRKK